jgi:uncharacterized surface protein with fasciclin (FAS1) repeats
MMRSLIGLSLLVASSAVNGANLASTLSAAAQAEGLTTIFNLTSQYPDLVSTLSSAKCVTAFLPSNAAFAKVDASAFTKDQLKQIISYHVVPCDTPLTAAALPTYGVFQTALTGPKDLVALDGAQRLVVEKKDGNVLVNANRPFAPVKVIKADIIAEYVFIVTVATDPYLCTTPIL